MFKCILVALLVATAAATAPVDLGSAEEFAILAKSGISTVPDSAITGDIGVSPITGAAMTGFSLRMKGGFSTSSQITGKAYAANYGSQTAKMMTNAIRDMEKAYTDAAGRSVDAANQDVKAGDISGQTLTAGVYNWGSDVMFFKDIYIKGCSDDIFIFQTTGNVKAGDGAKVTLVDGGKGCFGKPKASNIFWQVAGSVDAGTASHLEGVFLAKNDAAFKTKSSLNGRILIQTACTLDKATIVEPY